jgi:hypothetical protein
MVEIVESGIVTVAHVDDGRRGGREVGGRWFTADDRCGIDREQDGTGEEFILMGATGVGENRGKRREHSGRALAAGRGGAIADLGVAWLGRGLVTWPRPKRHCGNPMKTSLRYLLVALTFATTGLFAQAATAESGKKAGKKARKKAAKKAAKKAGKKAHTKDTKASV